MTCFANHSAGNDPACTCEPDGPRLDDPHAFAHLDRGFYRFDMSDDELFDDPDQPF